MNNLISEQAEVHASAAAFYLSLGLWAELNGFTNMAGWSRNAAQNELGRMKRLLTYLTEYCGEKVDVPAMQEVHIDSKNALDAIEKTLTLELSKASQLNILAEEGLSKRDHIFYVFLQPFLTEQLQSVSSVRGILANAKCEDGMMIDWSFPYYETALQV